MARAVLVLSPADIPPGGRVHLRTDREKMWVEDKKINKNWIQPVYVYFLSCLQPMPSEVYFDRALQVATHRNTRRNHFGKEIPKYLSDI